MNYGCRTKWSGPSEQRSSRLIAELWRCGLCVLQLSVTAGDIWRYDHHSAAGGQQPGQHVVSLAFCQYVSILGSSGEVLCRSRYQYYMALMTLKRHYKDDEKLFFNHHVYLSHFGTSFTKEKVSLYLHFCWETSGRLICIIVLLHNKAIWKSLKVTKLADNNAVDDDCSDHIQSEHTICQCVGPSYWCLLVVTLTANVVLFKWQM